MLPPFGLPFVFLVSFLVPGAMRDFFAEGEASVELASLFEFRLRLFIPLFGSNCNSILVFF